MKLLRSTPRSASVARMLAGLCLSGSQVFAAVGPPPLSCSRPALATSCADGSGRALTGSFFSRNGGPWQPHAFGTPLSVPAGQQLAITVCNQHNRDLGEAWWLANKSLIPTLVNSVGAQATLAVHIEGSANLQLSERLTLGENTLAADGTLSEATALVESALISSLVAGTIGQGARIDLRIRDSGNVVMATPYSHLHIGGGSLSQELIRGPAAEPATAVGACISVEMERANRVIGGQGTLTIGSGHLINEVVDQGLQNSVVNVRERDVANVWVSQVRIHNGELLDETVDAAGPLVGNRLSLLLENVGNVRAQSLEITDGELIDEVVDAEEVRDSWVELALNDSGNVSLTGTLRIEDGELIDEAVDVENVIGSRIDVRFLRSAVVNAGSVAIVEGELIDEAIDGEVFQQAEVAVHFAQSAWIAATTVSIQDGEIIDEALDGASFVDSQIDLRFVDSGSVVGQRLEVSHGELIDEMIDAEEDIQRSRLTISVNRSGIAKVDTLNLFDARLSDEVIEANRSADLTVRVDMGDSFDVNGYSASLSRQVSLVRSTLMDKVAAIDGPLERFNAGFGLRNVANIASAAILLDGSRLMDRVVEAGTITASAISLTVHQSANAFFSSTLTVEPDGGLMAQGVGAAANDPALQVSQSVITSGQRVQVPP